MEHTGMVFRKFFLRTEAGTAFWNLFFLALVQLPPPLSDQILGYSLHSGTFFQEK
jgi:hypothetical protein